MISPLSEEAERAASILRRLRAEATQSGATDSAWQAWRAASSVWGELIENACDLCLVRRAERGPVHMECVSPERDRVWLCDGCEMSRRHVLGLCTHTLHENPQPCSAERRCDECVSDGICHVCRRNDVPDMDRPCAECEVGRAEALMDER